MTKLEASIYIDADISMIDSVAFNRNRIGEWFIGIERMEADACFPEIGGKASFIMNIDGVAVKWDAISEELVQGVRFMYRTEGMLKGRWYWLLKAEGDGTRLSVSAEYEFTSVALSDTPLVKEVLANNVEKSLRNLAALVKSQGAFNPG